MANLSVKGVLSSMYDASAQDPGVPIDLAQIVNNGNVLGLKNPTNDATFDYNDGMA